jgi:signal peptidase I
MNNAREPWLGTLLSRALPGLGDLYAGNNLRGALTAFAYLATIVTSIFLIASNQGNALAGLILLGIAMVAPIPAQIFTFLSIRRGNPEEFERQRKAEKDPWLAIYLSSYLPGLGFFYLRQWLKGVVILIATVAVVFLDELFAQTIRVINPPLLLIWMFFVFVLTLRSASISRFQVVLRPLGSFALFLSVAYVFLLVFHLLRLFVVEPFVIHGGSMAPLLHGGDRILISKQLPPRFQRGDLITYLHREAGVQYVKRIAALEGEKVEITNTGHLLINGKQIDTFPFNQTTFNKPYIQDNFWIVPLGKVFVIGDNPERSADSRTSGPINVRDISGKAYRICWPPSREGPIK